jgi:hypothetical protein
MLMLVKELCITYFICSTVYSMSLRQQLQDPGKKPVSYQHFVNKDKDKDKDPSQGGAASRHVFILLFNLKVTYQFPP